MGAHPEHRAPAGDLQCGVDQPLLVGNHVVAADRRDRATAGHVAPLPDGRRLVDEPQRRAPAQAWKEIFAIGPLPAADQQHHSLAHRRSPIISTSVLSGQAQLSLSARCQSTLCAHPHQDLLPNRSDLTSNLVMVAYGGGKDSSYTLAFVRMIQLILLRIFGGTFRLRSVTNRHVGMPQAVLENIHRVYEALRLFDDPDCELLL